MTSSFSHLFAAAIVPLAAGLAVTAAAKDAAPSFLSKQWKFSNTVKPWSQEEELPDCRPFELGPDHTIDLDEVKGVKGKAYDECFLYNRFELKEAQWLGFGIGADWWVDVYLNGKKVFTTFPDGNMKTPYQPDNHIFLAEGRKGSNLLAIRCRRGYTWKFACSEKPAIPAYDPNLPVTITARPGKKLGAFKRMNAVNNGPFQSVRGTGNVEAWKAAKIPFARNHDASFYANYGGEHTVDVHAIFPDFDKDPNDPASYDFAPTDRYLKSIQAAGTRVFYRLGSKIEHQPEKYGTRVPKDFKKWAVICEHIIRHYNEGWANGFKMNIEYWEIWNEYDLRKRPEGTTFSPTWQGTDEQFFDLYVTAASHLKKCFPNLKIGGPSIANCRNMEPFLAALTANGKRAPLDFFSWHLYTADPSEIGKSSRYVREMLDKYGYKDSESILDEYNFVLGWQGEKFRKGMKAIMTATGAAFTAAGMISGQDAPLDMLMYYDARPTGWNGIFGTGSQILKTYYVFRLWAKLTDFGEQIEVDTQGKKGVYAIGATKNGTTGVMISRFFRPDDEVEDLPVTFTLENGDLRGVKLYLLDEENDLADIPYRMDKQGNLLFTMKKNTVVYIESGK
ncbi:MAG: hypothetical protein IJS14_03080 [Lentisphaeria bacterium]|nr:hypothetical protein [Lentisphaeria bacterium]